MRENDWTRVLGWPGYKVYRAEIDEPAKRLRLWVRRKRGNKQLICSGCGELASAIAETYEREVRDLPWSEYLTTVVVELYRLRCPRCGVKAEKVPLLPSRDNCEVVGSFMSVSPRQSCNMLLHSTER